MVSRGVSSCDALINRLDSIFARDPHIDELGIVHPSQISSLQSGDPCTVVDAKVHTGPLATAGGTRAEEGSCKGSDVAVYEDLVFYCGDHKLAIALPALNSLYGVATAMFTVARDQYRAVVAAKKCDQLNEQADENAAKIKAALEEKLLSSSRALVLVNCDHASAWNVRKRILSSREINQEVLDSELRLASIVLSCGPKSEEAWAHRRWVINRLLSGLTEASIMDCFLGAESELVEHIAERSPMNYRAWRHRYWLVSLMSLSQVMLELKRTKSWAQFHVSDNCCFHYRRCLLLKVVQASSSNESCCDASKGVYNKTQASISGDGFYVVHKELAWNRDLLHQYLGHEALWMHRRFLFALWLLKSPEGCSNDDQMDVVKDCQAPVPQMSAKDELMMADACISSCTSSSLDARRQREFAAAYKLWILALLSKGSRFLQNIKVVPLHQSSIERLLEDVSAHRSCLWKGLVPAVLDSAGVRSWPDLFSGVHRALEGMELCHLY